MLNIEAKDIRTVNITEARKVIHQEYGNWRRAQYEFRSFKAFISQLHNDDYIDTNPGLELRDIHKRNLRVCDSS